MRDSQILVCSCSTISWCASFLSNTVHTVYMPNYKYRTAHETFRKPISNTISYQMEFCSMAQLENILREY